MQDISKEVVLKIEDVPIVNEFMDVFPSEIFGMPPKRIVELTIDLFPHTAPIFKAPYKMTPPEMSELKTQLKNCSIKVILGLVRHLGELLCFL